MFCANILRRFRPCGVSQTCSYWLAAPVTESCSGGLTSNRLNVHRRSRLKLTLSNKVWSDCLSIRCLSTAAGSEDGNLIYIGSLGGAVRGVKLFSYSTSGASLFLMPQILLKTGLGVQSMALQVAFCGVIGFFTFLTPILLHFVTKGYVVRLYHNPDRDTYTAVTYSVFLTEKKRVFHQSQVRIPDVSKMFTTFYADHVGLLVNPDLFHAPCDYNHLMGYDKPFNFGTQDMDRPEKD